MQEIYYPSHDGKTTVHACIWRPENEIKGVLQIIHGMAEYAARYAPFAEAMTREGFLVCAEDHLGHGESIQSKDDLGYFNDARDWAVVISDIRTLTEKVKEEVGDKPYFVLGHSMGSFFCRKYISLYGEDFAGAVVMGSGFKSKLTLNTALTLVRLNALFFGWRNRSRFIKTLAFGSYNKKFKGKGNDWLSENPDNVIAYDNDELCGVDFTNNGYEILFSIIKQACAQKTISAVPKDLPVYFVAGSDDPVGDYGKGVQKAYRKFGKAGVKEVKITLYEHARHEILNDNCKDEVTADIAAFLKSHMGGN